jgi:hypothetical protein
MRLYLDTEFNGHGGELISMALVSPEGKHWYGIRRADAVGRIDPWVHENVIPKLGVWAMSDIEFRTLLHDFLRQFDNPEIICDWNADAVHFCQWLAGESYETSLDYACRITILKTPPGQPVSENPHNALADAEALMRWHMATKQ